MKKIGTPPELADIFWQMLTEKRDDFFEKMMAFSNANFQNVVNLERGQQDEEEFLQNHDEYVSQNDEIIQFYQQIWELFRNYKATDEKGRYVYWDKIKHKHGKNANKVWAATKISRLLIRKKITLTEKEIFQFCVPDSMQSLLHFIDKTCVNYKIHDISASNQNILRLEEAITSAQMEGAATTRKIAKELLISRPNRPRDDYEKMIINNHQLMQKVKQLKDEPLSIELILDLHRIATHEVIENQAISGEFRQNNDIFIADEEHNNIHQPPEFTEIPELMAALCDFANQEHDGFMNKLFIHPMVKAIMLHFFIGYIHPFGDGNGRTARALFYWFVFKQGYDLFEYISISRLLKQAAKGYGKSYLYTETDDLDMTYFIYYQLDKIKQAIHDLQAYVNRESVQLEKFTRQIIHFINKNNLDTKTIPILQEITNHQGKQFTAKEIAKKCDCSENTARKYLKQLENLNILVMMKSGNGVVFVASEHLNNIFQ